MKRAARWTSLCVAALAGLGCVRQAPRLPTERDASVDSPRPIPSAAPVADAGAHTIQLPDGDEIFAIAPTAVKEVDYETPTRVIAAIRPVDGTARFAIVERDSSGREIRRCSQKESFDRAFGELHSIRIRSVIAQDRLTALRTGDNAKLRVLSVIEGEPSEWHVAPIDDPEPQLALLLGNAAYELALSPSLVSRLAQGCGASGAK